MFAVTAEKNAFDLGSAQMYAILTNTFEMMFHQ